MTYGAVCRDGRCLHLLGGIVDDRPDEALSRGALGDFRPRFRGSWGGNGRRAFRRRRRPRGDGTGRWLSSSRHGLLAGTPLRCSHQPGSDTRIRTDQASVMERRHGILAGPRCGSNWRGGGAQGDHGGCRRHGQAYAFGRSGRGGSHGVCPNAAPDASDNGGRNGSTSRSGGGRRCDRCYGGGGHPGRRANLGRVDEPGKVVGPCPSDVELERTMGLSAGTCCRCQSRVRWGTRGWREWLMPVLTSLCRGAPR